MKAFSKLAITLVQIRYMTQDDSLTTVVLQPLEFGLKPSEHVARVLMHLSLFPVKLIAEVSVQRYHFCYAVLASYISAIRPSER